MFPTNFDKLFSFLFSSKHLKIFLVISFLTQVLLELFCLISTYFGIFQLSFYYFILFLAEYRRLYWWYMTRWGLSRPLPIFRGYGMKTVVEGRFLVWWGMECGRDSSAAESLSFSLMLSLGLVVQRAVTPWRPCGPWCPPPRCCSQSNCHTRKLPWQSGCWGQC